MLILQPKRKNNNTMPVKIIPKKNQATGNFNYGEILENKPIGFPQDGGEQKAYSNLFYWAHAFTSDKKSTIGLHPHRGFEICSFILKGKLKHFDTLLNKWISLDEGDVQVIKAGKGISHSEELDSNTQIFQIWFDPNIQNSLYEEPSYKDYKSSEFKLIDGSNRTTKVILNKNKPLSLDAEGIQIYCHKINSGNSLFNIMDESYHSYFILKGAITYSDVKYDKGTFFIIDNIKEFKFKVDNKTEIFEIISPLEPAYKTYAQTHNIS